MKRSILLLSALIPFASMAKKQPNIIYILADDLGFGDISAYDEGSKIKTNNIDKLCNEGMSFTDSHTSSSVSSPSRYSIMTGRYNWRTRMQQSIVPAFGDPLIESDRVTVADILSDKGYNTAIIGKWHLGLGWHRASDNEKDVLYQDLKSSPNDLGFDYSFITSASLDFPPYVFIRNHSFTEPIIGTIEEQRENKMEFHRGGAIAKGFDLHTALECFTQESLTYIKEKATDDKPFFLYFPLTAPHTPILPPQEFQGRSGTNAYGDFVLYVDDIVGRVMQAVKEAGIEDETIIIFTADNGCSQSADIEALEQMGHYPNSIYRGAKTDIFDGGHRVPFIVKWKGTVKAGSRCDAPISLVSFMGTAADIVGAELPENSAEDSYSILPLLKGKKMDVPPIILHSVRGFFALRSGDWKLSACPHSGGKSYPNMFQYENDKTLTKMQLFNMSEYAGVREEPTVNQYLNEPEIAEQMYELLKEMVYNGSTRKGAVGTNDAKVVIDKLPNFVGLEN